MGCSPNPSLTNTHRLRSNRSPASTRHIGLPAAPSRCHVIAGRQHGAPQRPGFPSQLCRSSSNGPASGTGGHVILTAGKQRGERAGSPCTNPGTEKLQDVRTASQLVAALQPAGTPLGSARTAARPRLGNGRNVLRLLLRAARARQQSPRPGSPFIRRRQGPYIKKEVPVGGAVETAPLGDSNEELRAPGPQGNRSSRGCLRRRGEHAAPLSPPSAGGPGPSGPQEAGASAPRRLPGPEQPRPRRPSSGKERPLQRCGAEPRPLPAPACSEEAATAPSPRLDSARPGPAALPRPARRPPARTSAGAALPYLEQQDDDGRQVGQVPGEAKDIHGDGTAEQPGAGE